MKNEKEVTTESFKATLTWCFESHDHVIASLMLRTKRGQAAYMKRRVELIPRLPQRVSIEGVWVGLNLVERDDAVALYISYPDERGRAQYELIDERPKHKRPELRLIQGASA